MEKNLLFFCLPHFAYIISKLKHQTLMRLWTFVLILVFNTLHAQSQEAPPRPDTLLIGYYYSPPFVIQKDSTGEEGASLWLWGRIEQQLSIPYRMQYMPLDSLLRGLASGTVDMSLNPLTITSERSERIDFSAPYYISNATVMIEAESSWRAWTQFLGSFFSINFLRAVMALFVVIFIFGFIAWLFERRANPEEFHPGWRGLWSGIWWSAVTMTTVGYGDKSPRSVGGRVVALVWMFAAIIIISGFTASIASALTVNRLGGDRSDIFAFKESPLATVEGSATEEWLRERFFEEIRTFPNLRSCQQALLDQKVEAVAYDEPLLTYIAERDTLSRFDVLPFSYNLQLYAFGFSEQLPPELKEQISNELLRVTESRDWEELLVNYGLRKD